MKKRRDFLTALAVALQRLPDEYREPLAFALLDYQNAFRRPQSPLARDLLDAISEGTDADHYDLEVVAELGDQDMREHLAMMSDRALLRITKDGTAPSAVSLLAENILDERAKKLDRD